MSAAEHQEPFLLSSSLIFIRYSRKLSLCECPSLSAIVFKCNPDETVDAHEWELTRQNLQGTGDNAVMS